MTRNILSFSFAFWLLAFFPVNAGVVLVKEKAACSEIVLDERPTRAAQFAAMELQYHVEKMTGVRLPIVRSRASGQGLPIYVGESEETRKRGLGNRQFDVQEYLVSVNPSAIILAGHDREDYGTVDYSDCTTFPDSSTKDKFGQGGTGGFHEQGSCYAVYDFLERLCGVRWYLPTELGLEYENRPTLEVPEMELRRKPASHHRILVKELGTNADLHGDILPGGVTDIMDRREAILWARRMRLGGTKFACNHSLYGYYARFLKTHPEWFAKGYSGRPPQLCYTSEGLAEQVAQDARDFFDGKNKLPSVLANGDFFSVMPMDNLDFCRCEACQKLLADEATQGVRVYTDWASRYLYSFINEVARRVAKTHPGKIITTAAYNHSSFPPKGLKLEPNVAVVLCLGVRQPFNAERRENDMAMLKAWQEAAPDNLKSVWLYFCYPTLDGRSGKYDCFPGFFSKDLIGICQAYSRQGVRGFIIEPSYTVSGRNALMDQLELYLITRLFDDPSQDGFALREEFFRRYFGKAGAAMKQIYTEMEEVFCDTSVKYVDEGVQTQAVAWGILGTQERMSRWQNLLSQAEMAADTLKTKARVQLFRTGVWDYMIRGRNAYLATIPVREKTASRSMDVPRIADGGWEKAVSFGDFYTLDGQIPRYAVTGKMKHDGTKLYMKLQVSGPPESFPELKVRLFFNDGWWFYFARQRSTPFHQLLVEPDGGCIPRFIDHVVKKWNVDVKTKVNTVSDVQRSLEVEIPLASLVPGGAEPGDTLFFNMMRANPDVISAWIPTFTGGRDTPSRFGVIHLLP